MDAIKEAGYHVLDLAHNHILDSQVEGVISTADIIEKAESLQSEFIRTNHVFRLRWSLRK